MRTVKGKWRLALGALPLLGLLCLATLRLFAWPSEPPVPRAPDAVVVLSGDVGDRLPRARRLMGAGAARVLVVSNGRDEQGPFCGSVQPYEVLCPVPRPLTTRGDALVISSLSSARRWRSIVIVTTRYHLTRATLLVRRCTGAHVVPVASTLPMSRRAWIGHVVHEWLGLAHGLIVRRGC